MANFANLPLSLRLGLLFVAGIVLAGGLNLAIYRLAWYKRAISPWGPRPEKGAPRGWLDRLPIVGWLRMRREGALHGRAFWIRPLLIELCCGLGLAALYWWEVDHHGLLSQNFPVPLNPAWNLLAGMTSELLQQQFAAHVVLFALMLVATFIDIDEKSIPDQITVVGTLVGLVFAAVLPWSLLPGQLVPNVPNVAIEFLQVASPSTFPAELGSRPHIAGLALGVFCFLSWCFALLPRTWYGRHGARRALELCWARVARERGSRWIGAMGIVGAAAIAGVWFRGGPAWVGLLTALCGMAAGGVVIWAVRLVGYSVLRREAMGFGDVTLMAMIGAFVGWQPCLLIFLLAPLAGVLIGVAQWLMHREPEIPYGPFLCLAAAVVVVFWAHVWSSVHFYFFTLGWYIPVIAAGSLVVMAALLWLMQIGKRLMGIGSEK